MADVVTTALYKLQVDDEEVKKADASLAKLAASEDKAAVSAKNLTSANEGMAASVAQVTVVETRESAAKRATQQGLDRWLASMDKATRANQQLEAGLARITRFEQEQVGTVEQLATARALVTRRHQEALKAVNDNSAATGKATISTGQYKAAVQNLGFQLNDIGTSLASGGSPFRVIAQQAGQIQQAFSQAGGPSKAIAGLASSIASVITPTTVAVTGLLALGAAVAFVANRQSDAEARVRQYNVQLRTMGTTGEVSAEQLDAVTKSLVDQGVQMAKAQAAVNAIIQTPGVKPAAIGQLAQAALDFSGARKTDLVAAAGDIARAFTTTGEAAAKFNEQVGVKYTEAERLAIDASKAARDEQRQKLVEYQAFVRSYKDANEDMKGSWEKAVDSFMATWNKFLDAFGAPALAVVKGFFDGFNTMVEGTKHEIENLKTAWDWVKDKWVATKAEGPPGVTPGAGPESVIGGAPGAPFTGSGGGGGGVTGLRSDFATNLQKMIADAAAQGITIGIASGFRTTERQAELYAADIAAHGGTPSGMVAKPGSSLHEQGLAADLTRNQAALDFAHANAAKYGLNFPMSYEPWHIEQMGARAGTLGAGGALSTRTPVVPPGSSLAVSPDLISPTGTSETGKNILGDQKRLNDILAESLGKVGRAAVEADARAAALTKTIGMQASETEKATFVENEVALALKRHDAGNAVLNETEKIRLAGISKITEAYMGPGGEVAGLQAAAAAQAELENRSGKSLTAQQLLTASSIEANNAAAKNLPVLGQQLTANQRLVDATAKGTAAEHEAALQNQVVTATHDALAKAIASGNPALIAQAEALTKSTGELIKRNDVLQQTYQLEQQNNQRKNQIEVLELQTKLQGQTTEEIQRQVQLLQAKQDLEARGLTVNDAIYQTALKQVDALAQANTKYAEAQRSQAALDEAVKGVADTVVNDLGTAFGNIFSGKKVTDWGATVKSTISGIIQQLATGMIIKPLVGSVLTSLGFGSVGQSFGSISGTLGMLGGGSSSSGTTTEAGGVNTGTLLQGGGLLKDIFGGSSGEGFLGGIGSSLKSGFNSVGEFLGFANPASATAGLPAGSAIGPTLPTGSLFGTTTLGSALGGVAAGFGGGMLLNSVLGGNQVGGTIGSGVGSLAGAAIGSIFGGPLIGGLIGGLAGGGLGGMFGSTKKPDQASGGVINLATGRIMNAQSGGNAQNDATASQIGTALSAAVTRALAIPGARLPGGAVSIQAGSRDGIKLSFGGQEQKFASAEAAIAAGLNALRDNLTGVSDTVQKVIHSIGSPEQIEGALAFADAYEKLATAADDAFKEVESGTKTVGPFETAMVQITSLFDAMRAQAEQYGLSVEPINKALDEATRRLNVDFAKAVDTAFNQATGRDFLTSVQNIIDGYEQMARDASAIGASRDVHDKLGATYIAELNTAFAQLTGPQLDEVIAKFGDLTNGLPDLARAAKAAADAAAALTRETDRQAAAYQVQQDFDNAAGQGFLAQLRDLDKARQAAQANAASLDLGDSRQGVIAETEHKAALTILQGLTNDQLEAARKTLADLNPAFADWVDEAYRMIAASKDAATATQAQADAQARANAILQAGLQIRQYLNAQETGTDFTSPTSRLAAARGQFQTQLGLARGGDLTALQGITGIADQLKQALQGYFASSAPGAQEWEDVKAALASLPGVPNAQQTQTNAIVDAITEASTATVAGIADATTASAQSIIGTTVATNAAIVDNARSTARDIVAETGASSTRIVTAAIDTSNSIVANGIASSARIVGATTTGLELATGATLTTGAQVAAAANNTAKAVSFSTDATKSGTLALLASNEDNAKTLVAGSKEDTQNLLAQQEANAGALLNANAQQSAALTRQNELNAAAVVDTTNATAASIVGQNNASAQSIIKTANDNTLTVRGAADANTRTILDTLSYWGVADINYQAWAGNSIVSMLARVGDSVTNSIFAADNITVSAIYGSSSNEIGATFANGNAIIGAIGSMSVGNIAATYGAANSIVAQVAASGGGGGAWETTHAVYETSRDITWGINVMSDRMAGYLNFISGQSQRAADLLQALFNMTAANFDQMHGELAAINDNSGKNARSIVAAIG